MITPNTRDSSNNWGAGSGNPFSAVDFSGGSYGMPNRHMTGWNYDIPPMQPYQQATGANNFMQQQGARPPFGMPMGGGGMPPMGGGGGMPPMGMPPMAGGGGGGTMFSGGGGPQMGGAPGMAQGHLWSPPPGWRWPGNQQPIQRPPLTHFDPLTGRKVTDPSGQRVLPMNNPQPQAPMRPPLRPSPMRPPFYATTHGTMVPGGIGNSYINRMNQQYPQGRPTGNDYFRPQQPRPSAGNTMNQLAQRYASGGIGASAMRRGV